MARSLNHPAAAAASAPKPSALAPIFWPDAEGGLSVIEIEARLSELEALGLDQRTRLLSGPHGPHVILDGRPVLMLCSDNYLGLAGHPRVRQAAASAAMRWGAGAGAARPAAGTMTIHRRLEERLAEFIGREAALLFGSGFLANAGVIPALARPREVVFCDELSHVSIVEGCRLSGAEVFVYDHLDLEHLAWGMAQAGGRESLIVSESVFSLDGDVAPLEDLVEIADRHEVRLVVDESHAIGTLGRGGRGALAHLGLESQVDVITGSLGAALGSYGAFVACDGIMARYLMTAARTLMFSTAPSPPAVAGALAALELLVERPEQVGKLQANAAALRRELDREGVGAALSQTQIVTLPVTDGRVSVQAAEGALAQGVFAQALRPPAVPALATGLRLTVMASHRADELRAAARTVAEVVRRTVPEPLWNGDFDEERIPAEVFDFEDYERPALAGIFDLEADDRPVRAGIFDLEADERRAA